MTAVNLALAFMQHEKKTVLIDGDLRKPSVAEMLGMEEQKGLAEYLKGNAKVKEVLQKKGDLTVIPGGKVHGNISSLMDESRMEELMTFLKSEFDYVTSIHRRHICFRMLRSWRDMQIVYFMLYVMTWQKFRRLRKEWNLLFRRINCLAI